MNSLDTTGSFANRTIACAKSLFATAVVLLACHNPGAANEILDTEGFENYSLGPLPGQTAGVEYWRTVGSGGGTASVENSVGIGGSKGVRVDRGANSDDWWGVSYGGDRLPASRYVLVDWDMKVNDTGAGEDGYGPFVGVDAYDDASFPQLLGTLGVDATTRDVLYQAPNSGVLTETGVTVDEGWHHYQIRLDFLSDLYSTSVDYVSAMDQPVGFVDGSSETFSDADIAAYAAGVDVASQSQAATAYIDNFLIREGLPGDYNMDGSVDGFDFLKWQRGESPFPLSSWDFQDWQASYGAVPRPQ